MLKDFEICPHCTRAGNTGLMMRLYERTACITRSDGESFHLLLFVGPEPLYSRSSGGLIADRATALFHYVANGDCQAVAVVIRTTYLDRDGVLMALSLIADLLASVLAAGESPRQSYYYDDGKLFDLQQAA